MYFKIYIKNIVKINKKTLLKKILKSKKKKWDFYKLFYYKNKLPLKYKKYKIIDQIRLNIYFFSYKLNSYNFKLANLK